MMVSTNKQAEIADPSGSGKIWQIASVALLGPLMTQLDSTVVNLSLSTIQHDLHASIGAVQWIMSGYLLALALALPVNGWLVDRLGAKRLYIWCFSAFTIASVFCGFSRSIDSIIFARALQGIAGGLLTPMTQMMIARFAKNRMAQVMGFTAVPILMAPLFGPVLAGAILKYASWPWLFYINLPIGILAIALAVLLLPSDEEARVRRAFDFKGFLLISPGLVALLYGLDHAESLPGICTFGIGALLIATFVAHARKRPDTALLDLRLFKNKTFSTAAMTLFLHSAIIYSGQLLTPLFLISGCAISPENAGLLLAPLGLGLLCSYPFMGAVTGRFGSRNVVMCGALISTIGTIPLVWMAQGHFRTDLLILALFVRGIGQGGIGIPTVSASYAEVPREKLAHATTASNIVQRLGGPVGTTVIALIMSFAAAHPNAPSAPAFVPAFLALICLHLSLLSIASRLPGRANGQIRKES